MIEEGGREVLEDDLELIEAEVCRRSLEAFIRRAWEIVEDQPLVWNWHHDVMCSELTMVSRGETQNLLMNVPPGCSKSLFTSVLWPAWEWTREPWIKYITASFVADLSMRDALKMRTLIQSPWYQRCFGVQLRADQEAKTFYVNLDKGWRLATSTDGRGTGEHPDRKIIDDAHNPKQARSKQARETGIRWYDETMSTRGVGRGARTVIIMQRLHAEDLTGHVLAKGGFRHICIPMRFDPDQGAAADDPRAKPHAADPRTRKGELLWPSFFTEERVRTLERDLNPYGVAGQLQQRPAPEGGGLFQRAWFRIVDRIPDVVSGRDGRPVRVVSRNCRGWDTAATPGGGDYTAGVRIADCGMEVHPRYYVEDVRRGQWGPADVDKNILGTARADGYECLIREEQEGGSAGKTVIYARRSALAGYDYGGIPLSDSKGVRAGPFRSQAEGGNVALVRGEWNEEYLTELENFPNGAHKDQVDGSSASFNSLAQAGPAVETDIIGWAN